MNYKALWSIPCKFCEEPTTFFSTKTCHPCWEVRRGLNQFLSKARGQKIALKIMSDLLL